MQPTGGRHPIVLSISLHLNIFCNPAVVPNLRKVAGLDQRNVRRTWGQMNPRCDSILRKVLRNAALVIIFLAASACDDDDPGQPTATTSPSLKPSLPDRPASSVTPSPKRRPLHRHRRFLASAYRPWHRFPTDDNRDASSKRTSARF